MKSILFILYLKNISLQNKIIKNLKDITIDKARARLNEHFFNYLLKKENTPIYEITLEHIIRALEIIQDDFQTNC